MSNTNIRLFATDKDLFDLLIAPRQRITERVMLELASDRKIFCSSRDTREELAEYLSSLPHDYQDVAGLVEKGEAGTRNERTTFITIEVPNLAKSDIQAAVSAYGDSVAKSDRVTMPVSGDGLVFANVEYSEFDYSRTHLLQRQSKNASIEFRIEDDRLKIRLPSTDRAQEIVGAIVTHLERNKLSSFKRGEVSVSHLTTELRTLFFINLMRNMPGYKPETVIRLKVASTLSNEEKADSDEDSIAEEAADDMLHVVENVALSGDNLLASPQYRQLADSGFFITSMTWRSSQLASPHDKVQFDISFEDGKGGRGFRYLVRTARKSRRETYPQHFAVPTDARKKELFETIEKSAHSALAELGKQISGSEVASDG